MKLIKLPLLVFVILWLIMDACSSGKVAFEHGNYYEAVLTSTNRLRRNSDHSKSIETLRQAYPLALSFYEDRAKSTLASNAPFKWASVVESYTSINVMYDEIRRSPGALKVIPNPANYYAQLDDAKKNAAEELYAAGITAMTFNTRDKAKEAYGYFIKANGFVPGYKDVIKMTEAALWAATLKVVVEPIPVSKNMSVSAEFFDDKISEYLHKNSINQFVRFFTRKEAQQLKLNPDHIVKLEFDEFTVGQVYLYEKEMKLENDSVVTGSYVTPQSFTQGQNNNGGQVPPEGGGSNTNSGQNTNSNTQGQNTNTQGSNTNTGQNTNTPPVVGGNNQGGNNQGNQNSGNNQGGNNQGNQNSGNNQGGNNQGNQNSGNGQGGNNQGNQNSGNNQGGNNQGNQNSGNNQGGNNQGNQNSGNNQGGNNQGNQNSGNSQGGNTQGDQNSGNSQGGNNQGNQNSGNNQGGNNQGNQNSGNNQGGNNQGNQNSGNDQGGNNQGNQNSGNNQGGNNQGNQNSGNNQGGGSSGGNTSAADSIDSKERVTICHIPGGNEAARHTLVISKSALKAHLAHGDVMGECVESKDKGKSKDDKGSPKGGKGKGNGTTAWLGNYEPVYFASARKTIDWVKYLDPRDTTKIYSTVKATLYYSKKTTTSKGIVSFKIIDAKTNALLSVEKIPGEYTWASEWATFNGDERALTRQQLQLCKKREQVPPPPQDLFAEFTKPIYDQITKKITNFYKGY